MPPPRPGQGRSAVHVDEALRARAALAGLFQVLGFTGWIFAGFMQHEGSHAALSRRCDTPSLLVGLLVYEQLYTGSAASSPPAGTRPGSRDG